MNDYLLLSLLFVAIGVGWLLGRFSGHSQRSNTGANAPLPPQYYRGLNFLLDGSQDGAIDAFTQALAVNSETLDTHIALGNVLRRRGEVERAIKVHQNLLARPSLPVAQLHLAHLELARDYISAGLLDRAERLLLDLVGESGNHKRVAQRHLLEIYESQRDWMAASQIAQALLPKKSLLGGTSSDSKDVGQPVAVLLAHYCCEQAGDPSRRGDFTGERKLLQQALKYDRQCVRASLMLGDLELRAGRPAEALKALQKVQMQNPAYIPETVNTLRACYVALDKRDAFLASLEESFRFRPSTPLSLAITQELRAASGLEAAKIFLRKSLTKKPSLRGLAMLMALHTKGASNDSDRIQIDIMKRLVESRSFYQCHHCGFKGQQLHWHCLGCKRWGTVVEVGAVGELIRD